MTNWTFSQLRALCRERGWVIDFKPDPERGLYAVPASGAMIRITLPSGVAIVAQSREGLLQGCIPAITEGLAQLGLFPDDA